MLMPSSPVRRCIKLVVWGLWLCLTISACSGLGLELPAKQPEAPLYRPPTLAATPPPSLSPSPIEPVVTTPTSISSSPTPACTDNLTYLEDQTIPDGSIVLAREILDKRWLVENSGTCNWNSSYRLKLMVGPAMGIDAEQALYPGRSGTQVSIRLVFTAPDEPGAYRSAWQAYNDLNEAFGDPIFIDIIVQ